MRLGLIKSFWETNNFLPSDKNYDQLGYHGDGEKVQVYRKDKKYFLGVKMRLKFHKES